MEPLSKTIDPSSGYISVNPLENLLYWCGRVVQYLTIKRVAIGLNETEQQLLEGMQDAVERVTAENQS